MLQINNNWINSPPQTGPGPASVKLAEYNFSDCSICHSKMDREKTLSILLFGPMSTIFYSFYSEITSFLGLIAM